MSDSKGKSHDALVGDQGPTYAAWEMFGQWCDLYRRLHPDDERDDIELIDVYAEET